MQPKDRPSVWRIFTHKEAELGDENKPSDGDICDKLLRELKPDRASHLL